MFHLIESALNAKIRQDSPLEVLPDFMSQLALLFLRVSHPVKFQARIGI